MVGTGAITQQYSVCLLFTRSFIKFLAQERDAGEAGGRHRERGGK